MNLTQSSPVWKIDTRDKLYFFSIVLGFTLLFAGVSMLRYFNFYTTNWDFGIIEQMLWTGSHGYLLYESANYVHAGAISFLEIHSAYIAIPIAYLYGLFPSPLTLFVLQSLVVSLSFIPIFLISRHFGFSKRQSYLIALLFLLNFAVISAILYDFHWESFIPVEFFTAFLFMYQKKYKLAALILLIGCSTLEVFPFLMAGIALFLMVEQNDIRVLKSIKLLFRKENLGILAIIFLSGIGYIAIRVIQSVLVPLLIHQPPTPSSVGYYVTSLFSLSALTFPDAELTTFYWILIFFSLGFISLLYPKSLVISLPWLINTFLIASTFSAGFGNQYAFIAVPPVFVGFIYGLRKNFDDGKTFSTTLLYIIFACILVFLSYFIYIVALSQIPSNAVKFHHTVDLVLSVFLIWSILVLFRGYFRKVLNRNLDRTISKGAPIVHRKIKKFTIVVIFLIVLNIAISPFNTLAKPLSNYPGYWFEYGVNPEYYSVQNIISGIPADSQLLASDNLFPYVANNPNAYSLYWFPFNSSIAPYFPFNSTNIPEYVLLDSSYFYPPAFLSAVLFNESIYGIVSFVYSQHYPGSVYLFKKGYTGSAQIDMLDHFDDSMTINASELILGLSGKFVTSNDSSSSTIIESTFPQISTPNSANIWRGPCITLIPGNYNITFSLKATSQGPPPADNQTVLYMRGSALDLTNYLYSTTVDYGNISGNNWSNITLHFSIKAPLIGVQFLGYYWGIYNMTSQTGVQVLLDNIQLTRA